MDVYSSEHEQVEALRRWWQKNGKGVLIGLALVLIGVFGWQMWQRDQAATAAAAAAQYQALLNAVQSDAEQTGDIGRKVIDQYPDTVYAALSNLILAAEQVEGGNLDAADAHLRWVINNSDQPMLQSVAKMRLARVELSRGNPEAALQRLEGLDAEQLGGYLLETRGDIHLAQGNEDKAREAYEKAQEAYAEVPSKKPLVAMKLDDFGVRPEAAAPEQKAPAADETGAGDARDKTGEANAPQDEPQDENR